MNHHQPIQGHSIIRPPGTTSQRWVERCAAAAKELQCLSGAVEEALQRGYPATARRFLRVLVADVEQLRRWVDGPEQVPVERVCTGEDPYPSQSWTPELDEISTGALKDHCRMLNWRLEHATITIAAASLAGALHHAEAELVWRGLAARSWAIDNSVEGDLRCVAEECTRYRISGVRGRDRVGPPDDLDLPE